MVQKRLLGAAVAAILGGAAISRARDSDDSNSTTPDRVRSALPRSDTPVENDTRLGGYVPTGDGESGPGVFESILSKYSLRVGVYLDNENSDSTLSLEWRRE